VGFSTPKTALDFFLFSNVSFPSDPSLVLYAFYSRHISTQKALFTTHVCGSIGLTVSSVAHAKDRDKSIMSKDLEEARNSRQVRSYELMSLTGKTRKDFLNLGLTESQVSSWFARTGSVRARSPSALQLIKIWHAFDWSPTYVVFGKGAKLLSQVGVHEDIFERMDRFQAVLQLALDEAEVNKQRYRGALKTIEDRNQQIVNNKKTLAEFGKTLEVVNKNMAALSEQLRTSLS